MVEFARPANGRAFLHYRKKYLLKYLTRRKVRLIFVSSNEQKKSETMNTNYILTATPKGSKTLYTVTDENGNVIITRTSARQYVACTIDGKFFFGKLNLIGKGEHGQREKWRSEHGMEPRQIAYLKEN